MPWNRGNAANRTCQADVINLAKSGSRSRAVSSGLLLRTLYEVTIMGIYSK